MKNKMNSNLKTSTTEPAAASTPEGIADTSLTSLRRSLRIKQPKIPCACCTTGMHVRCYTNVEGRRPIHSPRAVRRSLKRTPRVNATAAVERFSSARNNAGLKRNLDYIKRRRPLFKGGSERKVEETGEISVPDSDLILEAPSPPKRARLPNSSSGTEISTQIAVATLGPDLRKVPVTVGISVEFNVTVGTQAVEPLTQANLSIPNSEVQLMPAPAFEDNDLPEINESSAPISAAMKQENQDSQATGNTSDMEISNGQCSIPFIKIKEEPEESQVQSGRNGIVNSTMMTSFNDGSANEYYRQHSTSDEEGDTTPMLVRVKQEAEEEGEKPQRCGVM